MANTPTKAFELTYSRQRTDFIPGRAYSNPRFYSQPRDGVTKVYLVGDWPKIRADYEALGVPVEQLDPIQAVADGPANKPVGAKALTPTVPDDERGKVYVPDDWRDLGWTKPAEGRDLTLRGLASMFSAEPVLNKAQAVAAIEAELARRGEPETDPAEEEGSNGLTRREMHADLEAADVEIDPALPIEELVGLHTETRGVE